jgi:hypothetical protein
MSIFNETELLDINLVVECSIYLGYYNIWM